MDFIQKFIEGFHHAVIYDQRYLVYLDGLKVTILISIFAILLGVAIGLIVAVAKVTVSKNIFVRILKWICNVYTTVIRGTPVMVQLLIMGFNYIQTMRYIIVPQAVKNILPALGNEFIVLIKETSVAGVIAVTDLTKAAQYLGSTDFIVLPPLFVAAACYLVIVLGLTKLQGLLERRLSQGDHH